MTSILWIQHRDATQKTIRLNHGEPNESRWGEATISILKVQSSKLNGQKKLQIPSCNAALGPDPRYFEDRVPALELELGSWDLF
jgi:hypothetical protein